MRPLEDGFHVEFFCKVGLFVFLVVLVATVPWGWGASLILLLQLRPQCEVGRLEVPAAIECI